MSEEQQNNENTNQAINESNSSKKNKSRKYVEDKNSLDVNDRAGVEFDAVSSESEDLNNSSKAEPIKVKSDKKALTLSVIAILLSLGFAGYSYMTQQQVGGKIQNERNGFNDRVSVLEKKLSGNLSGDLTKSMDSKLEGVNATVADLVNKNKSLAESVEELSRKLSLQMKLNESLQNKVNKVSEQSSSQLDKVVEVPQQLLLVQAAYLAQNAQNELLTSGNSQIAAELLKQADSVLSGSTDPRALSARTEIEQDLNNINKNIDVDTNFITTKLSDLTAEVDNLVLSVDEVKKAPPAIVDNEKISTDISDWKDNVKKSVASFMSNFIKITPKNADSSAVFVAPDQNFYLRENIRFRLQTALLATYKGQNELYHQSLDQIGAWVRSYFDTTNQDTSDFLASLDKLAAISLDAEKTVELKSVKALNTLVNSKE